MCRNWQRTGTCKYGDRCKFKHITHTAGVLHSNVFDMNVLGQVHTVVSDESYSVSDISDSASEVSTMESPPIGIHAEDDNNSHWSYHTVEFPLPYVPPDCDEDESILHMTKRCRQANLMEDNNRNQMIEDIFGEDSDDDETVAAPTNSIILYSAVPIINNTANVCSSSND